MLQVSLLGAFDLAVNKRRLRPDFGPAGQRMASYLFTYAGQRHCREHLADLFWPDLGLDRARAALNSALWRFRRILATEPESNGVKNLQSFGSHVVLEHAPWLQIDVQMLDSALRGARSALASHDGVNRIAMLKQAADLYRRPFLEQEDGDWILEERERIHSAFVKVCQSLMDEYLQIGEIDDAIVVCRRVLSFDPYRETFVRHVLVLLCLSDRRAEAIRFFERWRLSLKGELGIAPMPATLELADEIRRCETCKDVTSLQRRLSCRFGLIGENPGRH
jgi:DNA-binding SARP family transcriptional activator